MSTAWMVVGLGNPGPEYAKTRHNIGAIAVEDWCRRQGWKLSRSKKAMALVAEGRLGDARVVVVNPLTYMNNSGAAVKALMSFYKVDQEHLVVLHDELDIDFTTMRLKRGGGDNGHNGLRSIRSALDSGEWLRVRLGIGRPPGSQDPAVFVLKPFASAETKQLPEFIDRAGDAVETLIAAGLESAQGRFNS